MVYGLGGARVNEVRIPAPVDREAAPIIAARRHSAIAQQHARQWFVVLGVGLPALVGDSTETFVCAYLSVAVLVGLALNAMMGWWWADPVAALAVVPVLVREAWEAIAG